MEEVFCHIGNFPVKAMPHLNLESCNCESCTCGFDDDNKSHYCSSPGSDDCECYTEEEIEELVDSE